MIAFDRFTENYRQIREDFVFIEFFPVYVFFARFLKICENKKAGRMYRPALSSSSLGESIEDGTATIGVVVKCKLSAYDLKTICTQVDFYLVLISFI